ncbi:DsbA family protein [Streptomyces sp. NPDC088785]|uniref:DsbA family oxidoreductase n=1 Tax=Streptomyces sp. NPDC088785 TaxID=3365897 RepID=UPI003823846D
MRTGEPAGTGAEPLVLVTEFTDPACPWAWGSEPVLRLLRHGLAPRLRWRRVFGILFDEDDDPAPDPDAEARWYEGFIEGVAAHTRAPYAGRLHWLTRTSWPASVVARSAEAQGRQVADRVLRRLRETTFVLGRPADTLAAAAQAVRGVPGLDPDRLLDDRALSAARESVRADRAEARRPLPEVFGLRAPGPHPGRAKELADGHRYALPTLVFEGPGGRICVPGWRPLRAYLDAASTAAGTPLHLPGPLGADAAVRLWRSLTGPELLLLTGASEPPADAVRVATGNGPLWLHPDEAARHPATNPQAEGVSDNETPKGVH